MRHFKAQLMIALAAAIYLVAAAPASASYGIASFDTRIDADAKGAPALQAAGHPYAITTHIEWNNHPDPNFDDAPTPDGDPKDAAVELPPGIVGNPTVAPSCGAAELEGGKELFANSECPVTSQVGVARLTFNFTSHLPIGGTYPLFNMTPPSGLAARFGIKVAGTRVLFDAGLVHGLHGYTLQVGSAEIPEALRLVASDITFWGVPADSSHDFQRCNLSAFGFDGEAGCGSVSAKDGGGEFSSDAPRLALLRQPSACPAPGTSQEWKLSTDSWREPGIFASATNFTHLPPYAPSTPGPVQGTKGCDVVPFRPSFSAQPSQQSAASSSGLAIHVAIPSEGILNPDGLGQSDVKKAVVTLPEGMTINPSQAEGLEVCTKADYEAVSVGSYGCPSTAKIGNVVVRTPLLGEAIEGNVYIAQPDDPNTGAHGAENPSDSLIALYIVLRNPERGIAIKLPGKVEPDPRTGQIIATFDDLPELPFESFDFKFREGPRAPLITPRTCGIYTTTADFYPWARPTEAVRTTSTSQINSGPNGGPCPQGAAAPFHPGFSAGTLNNAGGSYSPFLMRLQRQDGEQDLTKFSATLPPGVVAKIAGVTKCPDSWLALAAEKSGSEERESPSCPASSQIGSIMAGAGAGSTLVYVPGRLYLAGPYNGAPLSAVAIVPAVAGPFDVGTVITRVALSLDPQTAEVHVDGERSDPIPHILRGIPLSVRDIQVNVDRPGFTLNPTSCDPSRVSATLFGSNLDLFSAADDVPVSLGNRFQAASCGDLPFKPRLSLNLNGGTSRGDFPGLKALLLPRPGDANSKEAVVTLPTSAFLEQGHIRTICTRVQYAAKACPAGSVYGHVQAWTPLLDEPLAGPVYLRSSNHKLPDMVLSLHGIVDVEAVGRIDSKNGGIRASFEAIPDAPIEKVLLQMQGGKKGLIVNSRSLCGAQPKANAEFTGQNGKPYVFKAALKASCGHKPSRKAKRHHDSNHH